MTGLGLLILVLAFSAACPPPSTTTIYVSWSNGTDTVPCGTFENPCKTLFYSAGCLTAVNLSTVALFPGIHYVSKTISVANNNISFVIAGDPSKQTAVILCQPNEQGDCTTTAFSFRLELGVRLSMNVTFYGLNLTGFAPLYCVDPDTCIASALSFSVSTGSRPMNYSLTVRNCTFQSNHLPTGATFGGNAIAASGLTLVQLLSSRFIKHHGFYSAVSIEAPRVLIKDCLFESNEIYGANGGGGALSISSRLGDKLDVLIQGTRFQNNKNLNGESCYGGAVQVDRPSSVIVETSVFDSCSVDCDESAKGGAMAIRVLLVAPHLHFNQVSFINNVASSSNNSHGGALAILDESSFAVLQPLPLNISSSNFSGNSVKGNTPFAAEILGGAIFMTRHTCQLSIQNTTLEKNAAVGGYNAFLGKMSDAHGGALVLSCPILQAFLLDNVFQTNSVTGSTVSGGAIYIPPLEQNSSSYSLQIQNNTFDSNFVRSSSGSGSGGAIHITSKTPWWKSGSNILLEVSSSTFTENNISSQAACGGAVSVVFPDHSTGKILMTDSSFLGNTLNLDTSKLTSTGGALCILGIDSDFVNVSFIENRGNGKAFTCSGGALYVDRAKTVGLNQTLFQDNYCGGNSGGAVWAWVNSLIISNSTFQGNLLVGDLKKIIGGGAISTLEVPLFLPPYSYFIDNYAVRGGAIFVSFQTRKIMFNQSYAQFQENSALIGASMCFDPMLHHNFSMNSDCSPFISKDNRGSGSDCTSDFLIDLTWSSAPKRCVWPGEPLGFSFYPRDSFQSMSFVPATSGSQAILFQPPEQAFYPGQTGNNFDQIPKEDPQAGLFLVENGYLKAEIGANYTVGFKIDSGHNGPIDIFWSFHVMDCPPGLDQLPNGLCTPCPPSSYRFSGVCEPCPSTQSPCLSWEEEHDLLVISEGLYPWPLDQPETLLPCPNPEACIETETHLSRNCTSTNWSFHWDENHFCNVSAGYSGRLCTRCQWINSTTCYFSAGEHECTHCNIESSPLLIVASVGLILGVIIIFSLRNPILTVLIELAIAILLIIVFRSEWWAFSLVLLFGLIFFTLGKHAKEVSGSLKVLVFFVQTTTAILSGQCWPKLITDVIVKLKPAVNLKFAGIECVSSAFATSTDGGMVHQLVFFMLLPISIIVLVIVGALLRALFYFCHEICQETESELKDPLINDNDPAVGDSHSNSSSSEEEKESPDFWSAIIHPALFLAFISYFELCGLILQVLQPCKDGYMARYPWVPCSVENTEYFHLYVVAWTFFCLYLVGIPLTFALILFFNSHRLKEEKVEHLVGFLWEGYSPNFYWFELVQMGRRLSLAFCFAMLEGDQLRYLTTVILEASLVGILTLMFLDRAPYQTRYENFLDIAATLVLLLTASNTGTCSGSSWTTLSSLILNILMGGFLVYWILKKAVVRIGQFMYEKATKCVRAWSE